MLRTRQENLFFKVKKNSDFLCDPGGIGEHRSSESKMFVFHFSLKIQRKDCRQKKACYGFPSFRSHLGFLPPQLLQS